MLFIVSSLVESHQFLSFNKHAKVLQNVIIGVEITLLPQIAPNGAFWDLSGNPVVKILHFQGKVVGSTPVEPRSLVRELDPACCGVQPKILFFFLVIITTAYISITKRT